MKTEKIINGHKFVLVACNENGEIWVDETDRCLYLYLKDDCEFNYGIDKKYQVLFDFKCGYFIDIDFKVLEEFVNHCNFKGKQIIKYEIEHYLKYWDENPSEEIKEAINFIFNNE